MQFLAARGFFGSYNAKPDEPLRLATARNWSRAFGELAAGVGEASERAPELVATTRTIDGSPVQVGVFTDMLSDALKYWGLAGAEGPAQAARQLGLPPAQTIRRGDACQIVLTGLEMIDR